MLAGLKVLNRLFYCSRMSASLLVNQRNDFFPRDVMHERGLCHHAVSVRPSACLSVTFVYSDNTNKHIFNFFTIG